MKKDSTEKITINANVVDLGYIDMLVHEGLYASRTEFIKTAIQNVFHLPADAAENMVAQFE